MDVHASPEPLPELQTFLDHFQVRFRRPEAKAALERYTAGLLTEVPNKNCDTIAQAVPGTSEQRLQGFLTRMARDQERCRNAGIPPELGFQTKPEIALALLGQARSWGVPHHCVVADADYGDNPNFLAGLEERGEPYVVGVRADFRISLATQAPRRRADQVLAALPRSLWGTIRWRQGSKGWLRKKFVALYCWRRTRNGAVGEGWLLGERPARGQPGEHKYYWSNLPATTPLEKLVEDAHRRHTIEQFHEEAKGELGWDQYQGRRWRGFHRHAATVMLAYSFLVWLEVQHRSTQQGPGRPRNPFSPTAGPQAEAASRGASGGSLLATAPGSAVVGDHGAVHPAMFPQELTK